MRIEQRVPSGHDHAHGHDGHHDHGHDHGHGDHGHGGHAHDHGAELVASLADASTEERARQTKVLWFALGINGVLLVAEVIGGLVFGSLALLADAAHMLTDVAGLGIALVAQALMARPQTARHTYGLLRAEALGAQANAILLIASTGWIVVEAARRIGGEAHIDGGPVLVIATLGLAVNVVSAVALARVRGSSLNVEGAYAHMLADALGSVGAIVAALAVLLFDVTWVDTVASVVIALLVLRSGWRLLARTTRVLMEGAPAGMEASSVEAAIREVDGVDDVHHLHVWSLSSDTVALSAHLVMSGEIGLHEAQERGTDVRAVLSDRFGIQHATLELECHACED